MLTLSTTTATPWCSKTWSSSFAWSSASAYWNPEQPPPRTATRSACSSALPLEASRSLILPAALSVSWTASCGVSIASNCIWRFVGSNRPGGEAVFRPRWRLYGAMRHKAARSGNSRALGARVLSVLPLQVLEDSLRVVDHLVAVHQDRHTLLAGQFLDLRPLGPPVGDALGAMLEPELTQPPRHRPAGAEHVRGRRAA